jgi:hypothetical protein
MILVHVVPPFATRDLSGYTDEETDWRKLEKVGKSKNARIGRG